ncbi:FliA/WhiG family RNA polymerase sigma factor [Caldanaerobacter subterraneus]|jgi:RNA polymerase sigma factor for flagellar operon FliA|uniref:RNA polymerase sigma factor n=1 Tax=Caldanaerobacter subterraneus TaxID=911092 RepID=A0A4R2K3Q3_9THEO|nr:FliA/WhiG family RNA polymerase sigma factor [Caldanaerobacter subterraneus]TCO67771.1 RNA polymerase sigma-28 (SigD/FliA/WhiG) subunit [Caldanaerobacter subterraneus]
MSVVEEDVWKVYNLQKNPDARNEIIVKYLPLVKHIVKKLVISDIAQSEYEDLIHQGILGLIDAIEKYQPDKGVKFETYAALRIRGEIIDYLRKRDWMPRSLKKKYKKIEETVEKLQQRYNREPTVEEITEACGLEEEDVLKTLSYINVSNINSLEEAIENNLKMHSISEIDPKNPEEELLYKELKKKLAHAIEKLSEKERLVITLYYYEDLNYKDISKILNLTESRISQIHSKAIKKIREMLSEYF